jgi:hypothetical protein
VIAGTHENLAGREPCPAFTSLINSVAQSYSSRAPCHVKSPEIKTPPILAGRISWVVISAPYLARKSDRTFARSAIGLSSASGRSRSIRSRKSSFGPVVLMITAGLFLFTSNCNERRGWVDRARSRTMMGSKSRSWRCGAWASGKRALACAIWSLRIAISAAAVGITA